MVSIPVTGSGSRPRCLRRLQREAIDRPGSRPAPSGRRSAIQAAVRGQVRDRAAAGAGPVDARGHRLIMSGKSAAQLQSGPGSPGVRSRPHAPRPDATPSAACAAPVPSSARTPSMWTQMTRHDSAADPRARIHPHPLRIDIDASPALSAALGGLPGARLNTRTDLPNAIRQTNVGCACGVCRCARGPWQRRRGDGRLLVRLDPAVAGAGRAARRCSSLLVTAPAGRRAVALRRPRPSTRAACRPAWSHTVPPGGQNRYLLLGVSLRHLQRATVVHRGALRRRHECHAAAGPARQRHLPRAGADRAVGARRAQRGPGGHHRAAGCHRRPCGRSVCRSPAFTRSPASAHW